MPTAYECVGFQCGIPASLEQMLDCSTMGFIGPKVCSDPACAPYRSQVWICNQSAQVQQQNFELVSNWLGGVSGVAFDPKTAAGGSKEGCVYGMACGCSSPANTPTQGTATGPITSAVYPTSSSNIPCGCQQSTFSLSGSWPWWLLLVAAFLILWRRE